jgi:adenylate cyclase
MVKSVGRSMMPRFLKSLRDRFSGLDTVGASIKKLSGPVLVTSLAMTGLTLAIRHIGLLQGAEFSAYDQFVRMQPDEGPDNRLLVVGINENDLQTLQEWPISDRTLAKALRNLNAYSPRAIGIDILRDIPIGPGRQELLSQFQARKNTVVVCKVSSENDPGGAPPKGFEPGQIGFGDLVIRPLRK